MELNNPACLPGMNGNQLRDRLLRELGKDLRQIDERLVQNILQEMERSPADPALAENEAVLAACDRYRTGCQRAKKPKRGYRHLLLQVVAAAAVLCLVLMVLPIARGEGNFLDFVNKVRSDVVAFFNPAQADNRYAGGYQTDHQGLQQLYDAVSQIGITQPVVPTWIPAGYELAEIKTEVFPAKTRIYARFESLDSVMVYSYELYGMVVTHEYVKDETSYDEYECGGNIHKIYSNNDRYTVLWEHENLKCSIVVDCQEDQLSEILKSIYFMEDQ